VEFHRVSAYAPYLKFVGQVVHQSLFVFLLVGAAFALVMGLLLVFDSARAFRMGAFLNRWVSTRSALRDLEEPRSIAKPLYRMHRLVGLLICAGALYALAVIGAPQGGVAIAKTLSGLGPPRVSGYVAESVRAILLVGNFLAFVFGLVFIVRPSALKRLEAWADRRISARKSTKPLEELRLTTDAFTQAHPRLVGSVVVAGSLFVLVNLGFALLR
jgi:hypothetical protein